MSKHGADKGIRTPTISHTDLNRARLPIPPYPQIKLKIVNNEKNTDKMKK